jgi:hypothetical protein
LLDEPYPDTILATMTLGILVLFFVAILKKDKRKVADEI